MTYGIIILSAIIAIVVILMNLWALMQCQEKGLRQIASIFLIFASTRYLALIIYGDSPTYVLLQKMRYFYFASSIGLPMTTLLAVWYITPFFKERLKPGYIPFVFLPWNLFYIYVILAQPTQIIKGSRFGYELVLTGKFPFYLSVVQGSIVVITILICLWVMTRYKHPQLRTQLFFIIASQILLTLDGMSYYFWTIKVFQPFTITEAFAFAATYYGFRHPIKQLKQQWH